MSVIKRYGYIVNKQFSVNKKRNISTILGIVLSIILFSIVGYIQEYYRESNILNAKARSGNYEAIFKNVSNDDIHSLKSNIFVDKVGVYSEVYYSNYNYEIGASKKSIKIYAVDEMALDELFSPAFEITSGRFPEKYGEVIVDDVGEGSLNKKIGEIISIGGKEYSIVGFYNDINPRYPYEIDMITYFQKEIIQENINAALTVNVDKNKHIAIENIAKALGTLNNEKNVYLNELLFYSYGVESVNENYIQNTGMQVQIILYGIVLVLSSFLTYGSINVSIKERIEQFSILRCIGATPSKIRMLLIKESFILAIFSLIPGIILGQLVCYIFSEIILSKIVKINTYGIPYRLYFNVIILVIILTMVNIVLATIIPIIKIGHISPIDGVRNGGVIQKGAKIRKSKLIRKIWGYNGELAYKNIRGNNRSFVITTITSILVLTTFIVLTGYNNNIIKGYSKEREVNKDVDIEIGYRYDKEYEDIFKELHRYENEIKELRLTEEIYPTVNYFLSGIFKDIALNKWVKEKEPGYAGRENNVKIDGLNSVYSNNINLLIMDDNTLKEVIELQDIDVTLEDFKDNGVLIADRVVAKNYINISREPLLNINKGDSLTLAIKEDNGEYSNKELDEDIEYIKKNNREVSFKYLGSINRKNMFGNIYEYDTTLIVSRDFYYNNKDLFISEDNNPFVKAYSINLMLELNPYINRDRAVKSIESYSKSIEAYCIDYEERNRQVTNNIVGLASIVYIVLFLTLIIGGVNIVNNKYINIKLRGKEIGTLLALGISKKRLKKILVLEGVVQWFISSAISIVLSYIILNILYEALIYISDVSTSEMPVLAMVFGCIILFVVNILGVYLPIRKLEYSKTTELIRNSE